MVLNNVTLASDNTALSHAAEHFGLDGTLPPGICRLWRNLDTAQENIRYGTVHCIREMTRSRIYFSLFSFLGASPWRQGINHAFIRISSPLQTPSTYRGVSSALASRLSSVKNLHCRWWCNAFTEGNDKLPRKSRERASSIDCILYLARSTRGDRTPRRRGEQIMHLSFI